MHGPDAAVDKSCFNQLVLCGGIVELLARLLTVGMTNASQWLAKSFNLEDWTQEGGDGTGGRVLEMIHVVTSGESHSFVN